MNDVIKKKISIINTLIEAVDYIKQNEGTYDKNLLSDIKAVLMSLEVNKNNNIIQIINKIIDGENIYSEFYVTFEKWLSRELKCLSYDDKMSEDKGNYSCNSIFNTYVQFIRKCSIEELYNFVLDNLKHIKENDFNLYDMLTVKYRGWYFPGNYLEGFEGTNNSLITNRITYLKNNLNDIIWLYDNVSDIASRRAINALLDNWLTFSMENVFAESRYAPRMSANEDIFSPDQNEVFVDCGAYIGDTIAEYVNVFSDRYKKIYAYDISRETIETMKKNLSSLSNIEYRWKGVSDKKGSMKFVGVSQPFEGNHLISDIEKNYIDEKNLINIEIVKLDDDIEEDITMLKVDCEGVDKEALLGAKNHIIASHPKISVDAGHKIEDLTAVPKLIKSIDPSYRIFLRPLCDLKNITWFLHGLAVFAL